MAHNNRILPKSDVVIMILLAILAYFPIFGHLGNSPIRLWDEARVATSSLEMLENGNWLVPHFEGKPDMWNTKPPFLLWLQAFSVNLFGANEVSIRLPSAFAALFCCALIFALLYRFVRNIWWGFFSVLVLLTSQGYVELHGIRSGDYDSMLVFWVALYSFSYLMYCKTSQAKFILLTFLAISFACLTKGIAGLFATPGLFVYALMSRRLVSTLRDKYTYLGLGTFVALTLGYYLLREQYNPGYLHAVWINEVGGRFGTVLEEHKGTFGFYWDDLWNVSFWWWILLLPAGIFAGWWAKDEKTSDMVKFCAIQTISIFLVISMAQTKISWYSLPMFPFMCVLAGYSVYFVFKMLNQIPEHITQLSKPVLGFAFAMTLFIAPYRTIFYKFYLFSETDMLTFRLPVFFKESGKEIDGFKVCYYLKENLHFGEYYYPHARIYRYFLREKGVHIDFKNLEQLNVGEKVIIAEESVRQDLFSRFNAKELFSKGYVYGYQLEGLR